MDINKLLNEILGCNSNDSKTNRTSNITNKIKRCTNYSSLYSLEPELNSVGISIRRTIGGKIGLYSNNDTLWLVDESQIKQEISERIINNIINYITENADQANPSIEKPTTRKWQDNSWLFGDRLVVDQTSKFRKLE